ncbi:hypothetical protein FZEAL_7159 [Fusarium zealandicum]|uniref:Carbohydrate esterase family 16 protein n=1 Tax=Fusarium zealandicum TaxID=1053134 RepID=A0A8H4UGX4_9HYPO|nr:hypothetical protein FZEAL_7159 [Fusarium zealandicum]
MYRAGLVALGLLTSIRGVPGDSYSTIKFATDGKQPSATNPLGNPPYPGKTSSNGPNWVNLLTVKYNNSQVLSYDFAVGGSTVHTDIVDNGYDLVTQVYTDFIPNYSNNNRIWESETSLFTLWFGINDVFYSYEAGNSSDIQSAIISRYSSVVGKLYAEGARNFLLVNVPPIERAPRITGSSAAATRVPLARNATLSFNKHIEWLANRIRTRHTDTKVFLFDSHTLFNNVIDNPQQFEQTEGFKTTTKYCTAYQK